MIPHSELPVVLRRLDSSRLDGGQFDLSVTSAKDVFNRELRRVRLQGKIANHTIPNRCNVIESQLDRFEAKHVDFSRCDFKDNTIFHCSFSQTKFVGTGFVLNTVANSRFHQCSFFDTVIQNCEFYNVEFNGCDFTSLMIKDCSFLNCVFSHCTTSNKLFEMCLLNRCRFEETQLQLQTVAENFGLREVEVTRTLRSDRIDHPHEEMDHAAIEQSLALTTQPLSRLAFHYYLTGDLLSGSENLDAALDVGYWIKSQSTVGSFSIVLTRLCEFLLDLHENDELAYLPLVQLHSVTGALASAVPSGAHMRQAGFAVYGVHLSITRRINDWEILVRELVEMRRKTSTFLVEGKHTEAFYRRAIPELFMRNKPRIVSLVPHNSPWEMELGFRSSVLAGGFMALFLATRTRIELQRLVDTHQVGATTRRKSSKRSHTQIAQVTLGAAKAREVKPLLHLTTQLSPTLAAEFQLSVSTRCIGRVRKILLLWLK